MKIHSCPYGRIMLHLIKGLKGVSDGMTLACCYWQKREIILVFLNRKNVMAFWPTLLLIGLLGEMEMRDVSYII